MYEMTNIKQQMRDAVDRYYSYEPMRSYAHTYLDDKMQETFYFASVCLFHYEMFGGEHGEKIEKVAAALELILLSFDILDDIQDQDVPSKPWMQTPQPLALNVAFSLLVLGKQLIQESDFEAERLKVAEDMLNKRILCAFNGQMRDLMNDVHDVDGYMEMTKAKSASLIQMSCLIGVILATGESNDIVDQYSEDMGMMAQLYNDLRDSYNEEKADITLDKQTLPRIYNTEEVTTLHPAERLQLYEENGTILYMKVMMKSHQYKCMELFDQLPQAVDWKDRFSCFFEEVNK